jgi:hypothetical protein
VGILVGKLSIGEHLFLNIFNRFMSIEARTGSGANPILNRRGKNLIELCPFVHVEFPP